MEDGGSISDDAEKQKAITDDEAESSSGSERCNLHLEVEEETPVLVATETPVLKVPPAKKQRQMPSDLVVWGESASGCMRRSPSLEYQNKPRNHDRNLLDEFHKARPSVDPELLQWQPWSAEKKQPPKDDYSHINWPGVTTVELKPRKDNFAAIHSFYENRPGKPPWKKKRGLDS